MLSASGANDIKKARYASAYGMLPCMDTSDELRAALRVRQEQEIPT